MGSFWRFVPAALAGLLLAGCYNFHAVVEGAVYRSAQPQSEELSAWIRKHQIKTVIVLRGGETGEFWYDESARAAEENGAELVHVSLGSHSYPRKTRLLELLDTFDHKPYPMLLHCRAGADRTGLISAVYWVHRGGSVDRAQEELSIRYGHTGWFGVGILQEVLERYRPFAATKTFRQWVEEDYDREAFRNNPLPEVRADQS